MGKVAKITVMRVQRYAVYKNRGDVECIHCGIEINAGDEYVPRCWGQSGNKTMIYCVPCADMLNII